MKLLCATLSGAIKEIHLSYCPSLIDKGQMACLALSNSDIFYADSIVLSEEVANITEGDLIYEDNEFLGVAYYNRGWRVHSENDYYKKLRVTNHIRVKESEKTYDNFKRVNNIKERQNILVYSNGIECTIFGLAMYKNKQIVFTGQNRVAYCDELFLSTGFYNNKNRAYYFGQYINGGVLCLNKELEFVIKTPYEEKIMNMEEM